MPAVLRTFLLGCIAVAFAYLAVHVTEPLRLTVGDPWSDAQLVSSLAVPTAVLKVENAKGETLWEANATRFETMNREEAWLMVDMMKDVVRRGSAAGVWASGFHIPAAGKTGTTSDYGDAWFVGYTTHLATAVWMGSPVGNSVKMINVAGVPRVAGGTFPARIWQAFMGPAHDGVPVEDFPPPPSPGPGTYLRAPGEQQSKHQGGTPPPPLSPFVAPPPGNTKGGHGHH